MALFSTSWLLVLEFVCSFNYGAFQSLHISWKIKSSLGMTKTRRSLVFRSSPIENCLLRESGYSFRGWFWLWLKFSSWLLLSPVSYELFISCMPFSLWVFHQLWLLSFKKWGAKRFDDAPKPGHLEDVQPPYFAAFTLSFLLHFFWGKRGWSLWNDPEFISDLTALTTAFFQLADTFCCTASGNFALYDQVILYLGLLGYWAQSFPVAC